MANRDYVDVNRAPETLENYGIPSNPAERKRFEQEKAKEYEQQMKSARQEPSNYRHQEPTPGGETVFLVNNKARPLHITDEDIIIDGQLAVSSRGPFLQISKEKLDSSYQLQSYMRTPVSKVNPHLRGINVIEKLTEDEFKKRYSQYLRGKAARDAEYAKEHNNVSRHEDGTIDDVDAAYEVRKINPKILRAQGQ